MAKIDKIQLGDTVYNLGVNAENIEGKVPVDLDDYYNKEETEGLLEDKQNKLTAGENIIIDENNVISSTGGGSIGIPTFTLYYEGDAETLFSYPMGGCKEYDDETGQVIETTVDAFIKKCYKFAVENGKYCNMIIKTYDNEFQGANSVIEDSFLAVGYRFFGFNSKFVLEINIDTETHMPTEEQVMLYAVERNTDVFQPKLTAGDNINIDENNVISATGGGSVGIPTFTLYYHGETKGLLNNYNQECSEFDDETGQMVITNIDSFIKKCYRYSVGNGKICNMIIKTYDDTFLAVDQTTEAIYTGEGYFFSGFSCKFLINIELDDVEHMPVERSVWISNIEINDNKYQGKLTAGENINIDENNVISASGGSSIEKYIETTNMVIYFSNRREIEFVPVTVGSSYTFNYTTTAKMEFAKEVQEAVKIAIEKKKRILIIFVGDASSASGGLTGFSYLYSPSIPATGYTLEFNGIVSTTNCVRKITAQNYSAGGEFITLKTVGIVSLGANNTSPYTPTNDYNPATKKYVDDAVAQAGGGSKGSDVFIFNVANTHNAINSFLPVAGYYIDNETGEVIDETSWDFIKRMFEYAKTANRYFMIVFKFWDELAICSNVFTGSQGDYGYTIVFQFFGHSFRFNYEFHVDGETQMPTEDPHVNEYTENSDIYATKDYIDSLNANEEAY